MNLENQIDTYAKPLCLLTFYFTWVWFFVQVNNSGQIFSILQGLSHWRVAWSLLWQMSALRKPWSGFIDSRETKTSDLFKWVGKKKNEYAFTYVTLKFIYRKLVACSAKTHFSIKKARDSRFQHKQKCFSSVWKYGLFLKFFFTSLSTDRHESIRTERGRRLGFGRRKGREDFHLLP